MLTQDQRKLQRNAREFAHDVLSGVTAATGHLATPEERFLATRPFYEKLVSAGFLRRIIPVPFGGECQSALDMALIAEELYAVDASVTLTLLATTLGLSPVMIAGTPAQVDTLMAPFLKTCGAPLAAFASSEPGGSANFAAAAPAQGTRTTAVLEAGQWVINGAKQWVSSATGWTGEGADLLCVVCKTDPQAPSGGGLSVIAVPGGSVGFKRDGVFDTVGHRAHLTPRFSFDGVRTPEHHLIGALHGGKHIIDTAFGATAALVGIFGVGLMRAAFEFSLHFARTEARGGAIPIIGHQAVGYALADAKMKMESARSLAWRACQAQDAGDPAAFELALQSKVFGSETAVDVISGLMRVVGVDSYSHALPLGRLLQDAVALPVFDGGNMGMRRRQLHELMQAPGYDSLASLAAG